MVLAPHLDKSLLPEELNLIYMEAGVFPKEEELKGIIRMHGLLEPSRKDKHAFSCISTETLKR